MPAWQIVLHARRVLMSLAALMYQRVGREAEHCCSQGFLLQTKALKGRRGGWINRVTYGDLNEVNASSTQTTFSTVEWIYKKIPFHVMAWMYASLWVGAFNTTRWDRAPPQGFWGVHVFGKGSSTTKGLRMHSFHRYWAIHTAVPSWLWLVCVLRHRCLLLRCWFEQSDARFLWLFVGCVWAGPPQKRHHRGTNITEQLLWMYPNGVVLPTWVGHQQLLPWKRWSLKWRLQKGIQKKGSLVGESPCD